MNITLTLNYIQRIDKHLSMLYYFISVFRYRIQISYDSITLKIEKLSYSCLIVTRACYKFVTYLFAARPGEWHHTADSLRQLPRRCNFAAIQLKHTIKIEKLYTYNDEYKYPLDSFFLCHNLFAELKTHLIRSVAMFRMPSTVHL